MNKEGSTNKESAQVREVLTIYFNVDLVNQVDDFIHQNKKNLPISKRKRLSRTTIIGLVLQNAFDDYSKFGHNSELWNIFSKWLDDWEKPSYLNLKGKINWHYLYFIKYLSICWNNLNSRYPQNSNTVLSPKYLRTPLKVRLQIKWAEKIWLWVWNWLKWSQLQIKWAGKYL